MWTIRFYCFVLYSYQETSAKDHHKQEVTCLDDKCRGTAVGIRLVCPMVWQSAATPILPYNPC